jgi:SpoVK/Ycf46/Vps4 family AAA+-type ATPase
MLNLEEYKKELENQIKANRSLIYITSHEEQRIDNVIQDIACTRAKPWHFVFWDIAAGAITNSTSFKVPDNADQYEILDWFHNLVIEKDDFCILVLHDFYKFLAPEGNPGQAEITTIRALKNLIEQCNKDRKCVILTGARYFLPTEFEKLVCLSDLPLPEKNIITEKLVSLLEATKNKSELAKTFRTEYSQDEMQNITRSFQGLSIREIEMISTYFILTSNEFCHTEIASKKRDIIKQSGLLEWIDLDFDMSTVGGLSSLKNWIIKRTNAFTDEAVNYGLPENPKGLLIIGIQGAGKSRCSKAIASYWGLPLLRLDMGRIFSGIVGSSEENLRSVIKTAESVAPCIMWCDEIDKAFGGLHTSGDSGTSSRIFGTFLTWLQEKKAPVFVVATANNVATLPPELIRKGRFDEIFYVDLPNDDERLEIWNIHLTQRNFNPEDFNMKLLVERSNGFTGAEIEAAIVSAMYEGFSDNARRIITVDIIKELEESVPIYITMREEIEALREWAAKRARNASYSKNKVIIKAETTNPDDEIL